MSTCVLCQVKVIQGHEVKKGQTYIFDLYVIQCMFMDQIFITNTKNDTITRFFQTEIGQKLKIGK